MSSMLRNIQRRWAKKLGEYPDRPQPTIVGETGYSTLHPTRGWKRVSYARLRAQRRMAETLDR